MLADRVGILVMMAGRALICARALEDLFARAARPERVFVDVASPVLDSESHDAALFGGEGGRSRWQSFDPAPGRGLLWARAHARDLELPPVAFGLQLAPRLRMIQGWDELLLQAWHTCANPRALMTRHGTRSNAFGLPAIAGFDPRGVPILSACAIDGLRACDESLPAVLVAADLLFGPIESFRDVPPDPDVHRRDESINLSLRLWTRGWDTFVLTRPVLRPVSPSANLVSKWNRKSSGDSMQEPGLATSGTRWSALLSGMLDGKYGLGSIRFLDDYRRATGYDLKRSRIDPPTEWPLFASNHTAVVELSDVESPRPAPEAQVFVLDEGGLLYLGHRRSLHVLNAGALWVWCALEEGWDPVALLRELERCGEAHAEAVLGRLLFHWSRIGALAAPAGAQDSDLESVPAEAVERPASRIQREAAGVPVGIIKGYVLLDARITVDYASTELLDSVHPVLAHLEEGLGERREPRIRVSAVGPEIRVDVDAEHVLTTADRWALAPVVKYWVLRLALAGFDHMLNIHAGVVAHDRGCILLPGAKGSGKTTLTTALARAGFCYLSDEVAPVCRVSCRIRAVPIGLCVKESALPLMQELIPGIGGLPGYHRQDGLAVRYVPPDRFGANQGDPGRELPIRQVIFPRYRPGDDGHLEQLSRLEGIKRLVEESASMPRPLSLDDLACLVGHLERVTFYEMSHDSLGLAVDQVRDLLVQGQ